MSEQDPNGLNQHEAGAKLDNGKLRPHLVMSAFVNALNEVKQAGTAGAIKYSPCGWASVPDGVNRYLDAAMRHKDKFDEGEDYDPETGCHHLGAVAWNILAALELILNKPNRILNK